MPGSALSTSYPITITWSLAALSEIVKFRFVVVPLAPSDTRGESIDTDTSVLVCAADGCIKASSGIASSAARKPNLERGGRTGGNVRGQPEIRAGPPAG